MNRDRKLPKGWKLATIDDLFAVLQDGRTLHQGWSPQCERQPSISEDDWGVLKTTSIQSGVFWAEHNKRLPDALTARPQIEVKPGDLVITCAGPRARCGIACLVRKTRPHLMLSGKMYRFRVSEEHIDPRFVEAYLQTTIARDEIDRMKSGGSESGLNLTHDRFRKLTIPVAPLEEQKRIVAKIDELFTELEASKKELEKARKQLKHYRQAVLKAAVTGELTKEWRESHKGKLETASALLARILGQRRAMWEAASLTKTDTANTSKDVSRKTKYPEPGLPDTNGLFKLPSCWTWATLEQLSDATRAITYGIIKLGKAVGEGVATLRSSDIRSLHLDVSEVKRVSKEIASNYRRTLLRGNEVLITVRGTLGGVIAAPAFCCGYNISREVAMIALVEEQMARPLSILIASPILQNWLMRNAKGIAYTGINIETLKTMPIPLPPIAEQNILAGEVDRLLSLAGDLSCAIEQSIKKAENLRQSILKLAFEGKLVPQDPNVEPAELLLERIKLERAKREAEKQAEAKSNRKRSTKKHPKRTERPAA